jgi:hypothetical protein
MSADEPEKPETPLEGAEEEVFDDLVAGYRVQPKAVAESSGASEAAYTHGPRVPNRVVDTLPPNVDPPIVLNITQPLTVVRRVVEAEPPGTEAPFRSPEDNLTFPLPERRRRQLRGKLVLVAIAFAGLFAFAAFVRWRTLESVTTPADVPSGSVATVAATIPLVPPVAPSPATAAAPSTAPASASASTPSTATGVASAPAPPATGSAAAVRPAPTLPSRSTAPATAPTLASSAPRPPPPVSPHNTPSKGDIPSSAFGND